MTKISLNKASKALCISKDILRKDVKSGKLIMSDGCIDCEHLRCTYPQEFERAQSEDLEYYEAIKETAGDWKDDMRQQVEKLEKHYLVNQIRKLEAENYMLKQRLRNLLNEDKS